MSRTLRLRRLAIVFCCLAGRQLNALPGQACAQQAPSRKQLTQQQEARLDEAGRLNERVLRLHSEGKTKEAIPLAERIVAIRVEILGPRHTATASALNNLGYMLYVQGKYAAAEPYLKRALAGWRAALGERHADTATALNNLGLLRQDLGDYSGALLYFEQALAIRKRALGEENSLTASSYDNLALVLQVRGDLPAARVNSERAMAIRIKVLGAKNAETADSYNNVGMLLYEQGNHAAARPYLERALAVRREILGPEHPHTAISLNNLGGLLWSEDKLVEASRCYEQALLIWTKVFGNVHPRIADVANNLGTILQNQGDFDGARRQYEHALAIRRQLMGGDHPEMVQALGNLGNAHCLLKDYAAGRRCLDQALAICEAAGNENHPRAAQTLVQLADVDAIEGQWQLAGNKADRARRIMRRHISQVLPSLAENEQIAFINRNDSPFFHRSLSLGYQRRADAATRVLSTGWLLNGKAVGQEALAQQTVLTRDTKNPALAQIVRELLLVRRQLAGLTMTAVAPAEAASRREQLTRLEKREQELSRQVSQTNGRSFDSDTWIEVATLRQQIPIGAVLVDIVRLDVIEFRTAAEGALRQPTRYVAWIVPPAGTADIKIVDLGEAAAIDRSIEAVRDTLRAAVRPNRKEREAEAELREPLTQLAQQILQPILQELGETRHVYLSPDGALWLAPWGVLPLDDGRYAIEEYQIQYVVSGRDLLTPNAASSASNKPVVMADPNYDLTPDQAAAATRAVLRNATPTTVESSRLLAHGASKLPIVLRLPGTAAEARAITPKLAEFAQGEPIVYTDQYALEAVFKAVARPRVLVLSTHGYFLPDQLTKPVDLATSNAIDARGSLTGSDGEPIENPLLRCGLLLAGCNRRAGSRADSEDGVLTGMEITGADLRQCELVVLSACETAVGHVRNGEGVAGLRQAFQMAGASTVVATLWQIPDRESAQLMSSFFANLAVGELKADALRLAQIAMIRERRERFGAAHPYYWGAYTLTGR